MANGPASAMGGVQPPDNASTQPGGVGQPMVAPVNQQPNPNPNQPPGSKGISAPPVGTSPLPYQQVAPLTPQQLQAMNLTSQQTGGAQGLLNAAEQQQQNTIQGGMLGPNPYLNEYYRAAAQPMVNEYEFATAPNILQSAAQSGGLGGSGQAEAFSNAQSGLATGLGDLAANIYEPAYAQERQLQQGAAQGAGGTASNQYIPSQQLMQSGQTGQNQAQNVLNAAYNNLHSTSMWPYQALGYLGGGLGQASGGAGSSLQVGTSPGQGGLK